jgi:hypothetical protein
VVNVDQEEAILDWLETGEQLHWRLTPSATSYVEPGMYVKATFNKDGELASVQRVYPPQAAPYLESFVQFDQPLAKV